MATGKSPAYQWYPKDADTDETYRLMSYEQQGMYRALLDHQWLEGSIPSDPKTLAALLRVNVRRFRRLWTGISPKFCECADGRLRNDRLERQRQEVNAFIKKQSEKGKKSAKTRWGSDSRGYDPVTTKPQPEGNSPYCRLRTATAKRFVPPSIPPSVRAERWEQFWSAYPRRKAKAAAEKAWRKIDPDDVLTARIVAAVERQAITPEWQKDGGQFIPYPATWLNQRRWEDEPDDRPRVSGKTAANIDAARQFVAQGDDAS